ncbi:MAG: hypothetical protein WCO26_25565, partial [Deltaproteobacteria bacterium]
PGASRKHPFRQERQQGNRQAQFSSLAESDQLTPTFISATTLARSAIAAASFSSFPHSRRG